MAGHSKWKNIKHKKAAADKQKAKKFTKILRDITASVRSFGADTRVNTTLKMLITKAQESNMPKENYTRAIARGTGDLGGNDYESYWYEGYGPHGIALMVEVVSDNKNRSAGLMRVAFGHNEGTLADAGAVAWMFEKKGFIELTHPYFTEDNFMTLLLDHHVYDIEQKEDKEWVITCDIAETNIIKQVCEKNDARVNDS